MQSIHLVLGRSKFLICLFSALHGGASLMLFLAWFGSDSSIALLGLNVIIFFSWYKCLTKHALKTDSQAVTEIIYMPAEDHWQLKLVNGEQLFTNLYADSVLIFGLTLLKFKQEGCFLCKPVLVYHDAMNRKDFRQLRKWWRQHGQASRSI